MERSTDWYRQWLWEGRTRLLYGKGVISQALSKESNRHILSMVRGMDEGTIGRRQPMAPLKDTGPIKQRISNIMVGIGILPLINMANDILFFLCNIAGQEKSSDNHG